MHRYLLRWPLTPAVSRAIVKAVGNNRKFLGANYSTVLINCATRQTGITYSQWRCWKQAALARKEENAVWQTQAAPAVTSAQAALSPAPESLNGVFERYAALLESGQFKPESFVNFATSLCSAVYSGLSWLPWLHNDNKIIAFMQILMNNKTADLLKEPLYGHKHFEKIYNHLDRHFDQIPRTDCPTILMCLLYSGLKQDDPLIIRLLNECYAVTPQLNMHQIQDLTHVLQSLGGRNFALAEKIVCRVAQILDAPLEEVQFEIQDLSVSNPVVAAYMSPDLLERCVTAMLHNVKERSPDLDALTIGCCFRYARKMSFRVDRENLARIKALGKDALDRNYNIDSFQSQHIAEICHNAKRLGCFTGDVVEKIKKRSLQLLRDEGRNLQIREVTNLLFAFSRDIPLSVKQELSNLLIRHMDDADVLTLSNIADNMLELGLNDPDLITLFQWKVIQNIDKIAQYITRLVKVLRLLRERLEFDSSFNHQISEILLKLLDRRQGYDPTFVVVVAQFILPNVRTIVPTILMECLLNVIPRCNLSLMLLVLNGLEKMKGPWSRSLHNQVLEIRSRIQQNAGELIKNSTQASQLAQLVKGLHIKSQSRDFVLLDRMMDHYPRLTKTMSRNDYIKTVNVFKRMSHPYYHPEVFEDLLAFAKDNYPAVNFLGVLDLVNILASAAYRPEYFADFATFAVQVLEDAMEEENFVGQIMLTHYLSILQVFPDNVLGQIFTFDYLEEMDSIIEAEPDRQPFLKKLMMQLNRSVILECPHLDVPWFHDQYCREVTQTSGTKDFQRNLIFVEEVEGALQEVMRGLKFVARNVYSQYFHPIDFEVVLDSKGQPIPNAAVKLVNPADLDYQRVALMLIGNQQLCANSHRRRGHYLLDKRHLEILGYRVEEIPRYDWNSMALSDWGSKVSYMQDKIYGRGGARDPAASKTTTSSWVDSPVMHPYWK